ncbi:MAG: hypothetical protein IJA14_03630 [Alphaproteobacteria bacterium]|nr:hypothetical protein [Alphaproteobacteria bacterium]
MKKFFNRKLYSLLIAGICFFAEGMTSHDSDFITLNGKVFAELGDKMIFLVNINDFIPKVDSLNVVNSNDSKNFGISMNRKLSLATNNRNETLSKSKSCPNIFSVDKNLGGTESEDQINVFPPTTRKSEYGLTHFELHYDHFPTDILATDEEKCAFIWHLLHERFPLLEKPIGRFEINEELISHVTFLNNQSDSGYEKIDLTYTLNYLIKILQDAQNTRAIGEELFLGQDGLILYDPVIQICDINDFPLRCYENKVDRSESYTNFCSKKVKTKDASHFNSESEALVQRNDELQ